jgi:hypothetical protein
MGTISTNESRNATAADALEGQILVLKTKMRELKRKQHLYREYSTISKAIKTCPFNRKRIATYHHSLGHLFGKKKATKKSKTDG